MTLRLSIENVPSLTSGDPIEVTLEEHGMVIGRAAHADWTLPDPRNHVSSIHCEIDYRDGRYFITDRSTNGTFINGAADRPTKPTQLRDGDLVQIGHYQVRIEEVGDGGGSYGSPPAATGFGTGVDWTGGAPVSAKPINAAKFGREPARPLFQSSGDPLMNAFAAPSAAAAGSNPFGIGAPAPAPYSPPSAAAPDPFGLSGPSASHEAAAYTPNSYTPPPTEAANPFGLGAAQPPAGAPDPFGFGAPAAAPAYAPPAPQAAAAGDPWATLSSFGAVDFSVAEAPPPVATAAAAAAPVARPAAAEAGLFDRLLAGAGLKRADLGLATPEAVVEIAGQLLRQTADGLIRLLDARTRIRHQFGVGAQVTTFQRAGNNPLKWTRSPEQALKQMIGEPEPGFLPGAQSVRGAFEDLQAHEMAMLAAMQEAMQATIERFAPDNIKTRINAKGWLKSVLPGSREATLWRAYESEFRAFADESEAAYLDLFAKHFKKAYERNVAKAGPG